MENQFDAFFPKKKHYENYYKNLMFQRTTKVIDEIERLNPKPGGSYGGNLKNGVNMLCQILLLELSKVN
jgi:RNA polymerase sigma-54 factor